MARKRNIMAPSAEDLARLDQETAQGGFAAKPRIAPIAQVAAEAAGSAPVEAPEEAARNRADATILRRARADGWEVRDLPMAEIHVDAMSRDRMDMPESQMEELRASIRANGMRMPVEVTARRGGGYDLISGLRRLTASRDIAGPDATIRAFVRPPRTAPEALVAMVEENEIRANLSSYERGRAAVLAVQDGVFPTIEAAVDALFATASKGKRSKVRSFALLHEELGDLLAFPNALSERQCLRLSAAIKAGQGGVLRAALAPGPEPDAEAEWALLNRALSGLEKSDRPARPRPQAVPTQGYIPLSRGRAIRHVQDAEGHAIRFEGPVDADLIDRVMREIATRLTGDDPGE
ncbi:ParB/RepB/Spo0J family partition protein [Jannaschia sp. 2305UL9-9]|uniref:ParB/RepB/Spo0J family partition protein n=1 Tax=Jannaschia sp. 2305UL9-9 TaxID=3121638 RepID=UPI0035270711